ncbi:MAG TPA: hypothetical protein V6C82_03070 [Chroococcales cyanobacterium]
MSTAKEEILRRILDVTDHVAGEVLDFLEYLDNKEKRKIPFANCPIDDEPLTEEDMAAIREGREAIKRGEVVSLEEIKKELGFDGLEG